MNLLFPPNGRRHIGREKEYLDIAIDFAIDINSDRILVGFLPDFVKR